MYRLAYDEDMMNDSYTCRRRHRDVHFRCKQSDFFETYAQIDYSDVDWDRKSTKYIGNYHWRLFHTVKEYAGCDGNANCETCRSNASSDILPPVGSQRELNAVHLQLSRGSLAWMGFVAVGKV